ncbi:MAG: recombination mediator RecR [Rickettsiales bacterium]|jgi:recombination protein RecR|nr:recombination mediator RecR [Rickettsiales bacterium]
MVLLDKLILQFSKLPRIGRRAASRIAVALLEDKTGLGRELANAIATAVEKVRPCPVCGCLAEGGLCDYCGDGGRANGQLCVVRDFADVSVLEKAGIFHGRYHIIGGLLSGANGITPEDLRISNLPERIRSEGVTEIIFALPNTMEGKTTEQYVASKLSGAGAAFSELASGVPMGGDLDYIDDGTLALAFGDRKVLK